MVRMTSKFTKYEYFLMRFSGRINVNDYTKFKRKTNQLPYNKCFTIEIKLIIVHSLIILFESVNGFDCENKTRDFLLRTEQKQITKKKKIKEILSERVSARERQREIERFQLIVQFDLIKRKCVVQIISFTQCVCICVILMIYTWIRY